MSARATANAASGFTPRLPGRLVVPSPEQVSPEISLMPSTSPLRRAAGPILLGRLLVLLGRPTVANLDMKDHAE